MRYKVNGAKIFIEAFVRMTAIINFIAMVRFLKTTCCSILKHLLAANFKDKRFFSLIFTYFGIVKING